MAADKKKQTPRGGQPRRASNPVQRNLSVATTPARPFGLFANDPTGTGGDAPLVSRVDFRRRGSRSGSDETFVGGRGINMSLTENRNFVADMNRHERSMFRRLSKAEQEDWDVARREQKDLRDREQAARRRQEYADRNFEGAKFDAQSGWDNLGRTKGVDAEGNAVVYGRGAEGVTDYDKRYAELKKKADALSEAFDAGDFTGRGKEWKAIRNMVRKSHESGGLTEKQMEGIEKKMESLSAGLSDSADRARRFQKFYEKKDLQKKRQQLGDTYGLLSDDQVRTMSEKQRWDNVRKASDAYLASVSQRNEDGSRVDPDTVQAMGFDKQGNFGVVSRGGDRVQAMQDLLDNGISLSQMARLAVRSGDKKWTDAYGKIMSSGSDTARKNRAVESLGHAYLRSMLDQGDDGIKALSDAIASETSVGGGGQKKGPSDGSPTTTAEQRMSETARRDALPVQSQQPLSPKAFDVAASELAKPVPQRQQVESNDGGQVLPMTADEFVRVQTAPVKARGQMLPAPTQDEVATQLGTAVFKALQPRTQKKPEDL